MHALIGYPTACEPVQNDWFAVIYQS